MKVLIVDDSMYSIALISVVIRKMGHQIVGEARNAEEARRMIKDLKPDLITLDNILNDMKGTDVISGLGSDVDPRRVIVISGSDYESTASRYRSLGIKTILPKPFDPMALQQAINQIPSRTLNI